MASGGWNVAGRQFRTRTDYEAACRDEKKIESLKTRYKLDNPDRVAELNKEIQTGKIHFETMVGDDFIYEIEQMAKKTVPEAKKKKQQKRKL